MISCATFSASDFVGPSAAESLSDRFLFDFLDSPTNKNIPSGPGNRKHSAAHLRFAHGELFRYRTSATSALYPTLTLEAEHIETEWQWMGSYGKLAFRAIHLYVSRKSAVSDAA